jgi:hypothetical protein
MAQLFGAFLYGGNNLFSAHSLLLIEWWSTLPRGHGKMQVAEKTRANSQKPRAGFVFAKYQWPKANSRVFWFFRLIASCQLLAA